MSTGFLAGDRTLDSEGSIRLEAIWRSLVVVIPVLAGAVCSVIAVVSSNPIEDSGPS